MTASPSSYGSHLRRSHFLFSPSYHPLNHGSFGTFPKCIRDYQRSIQDQVESRSDPFIRVTQPKLLRQAREAVAPLLGADVREVVFVANATTGVNTVLRNLVYEDGDVILYFNFGYDGCVKTILSVCETTQAEAVRINVAFPIEDDELIGVFEEKVTQIGSEGRRVRIAMFDVVVSFPGVRLPWERLVKSCKGRGVLSLIDGAHGIGHVDLTHLADTDPDFFTSNCHKYVHLSPQDTIKAANRHRWLFTPRPCAVFYVPSRNQHLMRTTFPTSHGFRALNPLTPHAPPSEDAFGDLFEVTATIDKSSYLCAPQAIKFRKEVLGGEESIREYCFKLARGGGKLVAAILGTEVMENKEGTLGECCFAMVRLSPVYSDADVNGSAENGTSLPTKAAPEIAKWMSSTLMEKYDTFIPGMLYEGAMWMRLSAQVYLDLEDFRWAGNVLKELCRNVEGGEWKQSSDR